MGPHEHEQHYGLGLSCREVDLMANTFGAVGLEGSATGLPKGKGLRLPDTFFTLAFTLVTFFP
jgi:hypothetical protein